MSLSQLHVKNQLCEPGVNYYYSSFVYTIYSTLLCMQYT